MKTLRPVAWLCILAAIPLAPGTSKPNHNQTTSQDTKIIKLIKTANATAARMDAALRRVKPVRKSIATGTDNGGELTILQRSNYRILEPGIGLSHWLYSWPIYLQDGKTVLVKRITQELSLDGTSIAHEKEERFYLFGDKMLHVPQASQPLKWQILPKDSKTRKQILANIHFAIRGAASKDKDLMLDDEALHTP